MLYRGPEFFPKYLLWPSCCWDVLSNLVSFWKFKMWFLSEVDNVKKVSEGIVIEKRGEFALVRPLICGPISCSCHDDETGAALVNARNDLNAAVGDKVIFEAPEAGMLLTAFIAFILPIILVVAGAAIGYNMAQNIGISPALTAGAGGCLFFIIALIIIKMHDKSVANDEKYTPIIVRVSSKNYIALNPLNNGQKYYVLDDELIR